MSNNENHYGYAPNASVTSSENCQVTGKLGKDTSSILYDLVDFITSLIYSGLYPSFNRTKAIA